MHIIQDNNLADCQILKIIVTLSKKWGRSIVTPNIAKKLIARKSLLDVYFTKCTLDDSSEQNFKDNTGNVIKRDIVYCHDIPVLIAFKKLVEKPIDSHALINVIGMDDGKDMLKITFNWSKTLCDKGRCT